MEELSVGGTASLREFDRVRVVRLRLVRRWCHGDRPPHIGDTGTIVHWENPDDPASLCIVECMSGFETIWVADFAQDELERIRE